MRCADGAIHQRTANVGAGAGPGSVHPAGPPVRRDIRAKDVSKRCFETSDSVCLAR